MATSNRRRSDSNKSVYGQVQNFNISRSGSNLSISGTLYIDATAATNSTLGSSSYTYFTWPIYFYTSSNALIGAANIPMPSWGSGYGLQSGTTYSLNFSTSASYTDSYSGSIICKIGQSGSSFSWFTSYPLTIESVSWSGYSGSSSSDSGFSWDSGSYTPTTTYPSNPSSFTTSTGDTKFKSGASVILKWSAPSTFGDFSFNYYYELVANGKTLYSGTNTSYTTILNSSTTYTIYCKSGTGITSGSGRQLSLIVPDNIGSASITGVGMSNSNPGFSPMGKNDNILISWEKPSVPNNNSIANYSIYFNGNLVASEITDASYILNNYELTETNYKVVVRAYDSVGQYTDSKDCYLYTVNPYFSYGPRGETSILLENSKINWGELKTGSLNNDLLSIRYDLAYTSISTAATIADGDSVYKKISNGLTETNFEWDTTEENIQDGDLISLKVTGIVSYGNGEGDNIDIVSVEIKSEKEEQLFKGKLPSKFNKIIFSIPEGQYYGISSPMQVIFNVDSDNWEKGIDNTIYNFTKSLQIKCLFNDDWEKSNEYIDAVQIKWKKGLYSGEKVVGKNSEDNTNYFSVILDDTTDAELFGQSNEPITFEIYSLYETKDAENIGTGVYIFSDSASLSFKKATNFSKAVLPQMYNNGTSIPSINSNIVRNVDFFKKEINSTAAIDGFWSKDYQLTDLRANSVISSVPVIGFKIYATKDLENYKENGSIVNIPNYLKQTNGTVNFNTDGFFEISLPLLSSGDEAATSTTNNFVGFYPQILNDDGYLKQLFGGISSLQTLSTVENFYYVIAAIDALKQESIVNYILSVTYDFRLAAEFQEGTTPILNNPGFTSVTIKEKTGYLFYGQTDVYDWITFEWYPAFNKNDYLLNPDHYEQIDGIYYLKEGEEYLDPNSYTLYKWINGEYRSKKLTNNDFKTEIVTISGKNVKKYKAKYAMNLKDTKVSEYFNLTLMPSYIDQYKEEKMATPLETINPITENNQTVYFYLSRFIPMGVTINSDGIKRAEQTDFIVNLNINDWGVLIGDGINKISSKMTLKNSSIKKYTGSENVLSNEQGSFELEITPTYGTEQIVYDFIGHVSKIYDNMPFSSETTIVVTIDRYLENDYIISKSGTSSVITTYNYYIPANFSTLSLRKNKVGINYSNLTNTEEALYIVAKDRIDSGNDSGNVAIYGNTYPHVFSIQGNPQTKMPDFNKYSGEALTGSLTEVSTYMGFYTVNENNEPYRVGSFGMEKGEPYFVYKGKYYSDSGIGQNSVEKRYDNKDYFEKISLINLPVPPGTIVLFPCARISNSNGKLNQSLLTAINKTWFICDGETTLYPRNNANLIKAIYGETAIENPPEEGFKVPELYPEEKLAKTYCYIIKGDA